MNLTHSMLEKVKPSSTQEKPCTDWLYIGEEGQGAERYILGKPGKRTLIFIGLNPSTAAPGAADPTVTQIQKRIKDCKCDGWIALNLYPLRETKPERLPKAADAQLLKNNALMFRTVLEGYPNAPVWVGWGTNISKRSYLKNVLLENLDLLEKREILCLGPCSKDGHPHHPLRLATDTHFENFDLGGYLQRMLVISTFQ